MKLHPQLLAFTALFALACASSAPDAPPLEEHERSLLALSGELTPQSDPAEIKRRLPDVAEPMHSGPVTSMGVDTVLFGVGQRGEFTFAGELLMQFSFDVEQLEKAEAEQLFRRYVAGLTELYGPGESSRGDVAPGMAIRSVEWQLGDSRLMAILGSVPDEGWTVIWVTRLLSEVPRELFENAPAGGRDDHKDIAPRAVQREAETRIAAIPAPLRTNRRPPA